MNAKIQNAKPNADFLGALRATESHFASVLDIIVPQTIAQGRSGIRRGRVFIAEIRKMVDNLAALLARADAAFDAADRAN